MNHVAADIPVFFDLNGTIAAIIGFDQLSLSGVTGLLAAALARRRVRAVA